MNLQQVLDYLQQLSSQELEDVFKEFVEYRENWLLEEVVMKYEMRIEELEEEVEILRNGNAYY